MTIAELKKDIKEMRKEMKTLGIRVTSCFNGGLTSDEYRYNSQLFALKIKLESVQKAEASVRT